MHEKICKLKSEIDLIKLKEGHALRKQERKFKEKLKKIKEKKETTRKLSRRGDTIFLDNKDTKLGIKHNSGYLGVKIESKNTMYEGFEGSLSNHNITNLDSFDVDISESNHSIIPPFNEETADLNVDKNIINNFQAHRSPSLNDQITEKEERMIEHKLYGRRTEYEKYIDGKSKMLNSQF